MKRKKGIILALIFLILIVGGLVYNYTFNSEHRDISSEKATVTISAKDFYSQFEANESQATTNYLDKVIETNGEITLIENNDVVLNNRVQVSFNSNEILKFQKGESLMIKGRCVGYDELLEMVKIDQATIINKTKQK